MKEIMTNRLTGDQDPISMLDEQQTEPYGHLSFPQQLYAEAAVRSIVDLYGLDEDDVRLIIEKDDEDNKRFVLIDGSPNGQYYGNYAKVMSLKKENPNIFNVIIDEEPIDTLMGTTYSIYWSMVCESAYRGVIAPDSVALSHQNDLPWTATMLTGEPLTDDGLILVASVSSGAVSHVGFKTNRGGSSIRLRPSVWLPRS